VPGRADPLERTEGDQPGACSQVEHDVAGSDLRVVQHPFANPREMLRLALGDGRIAA
jgi:hypothetical protein